jgi:hypothetical protein
MNDGVKLESKQPDRIGLRLCLHEMYGKIEMMLLLKS